jgi:hypothetical protein
VCVSFHDPAVSQCTIVNEGEPSGDQKLGSGKEEMPENNW